MTPENMNAIEREAIAHYGPSRQLIKAVEELCELGQALSKHIAATGDEARRTALSAIYEEMADVEIMLDQLRILFPDAPDRVAWWKRQKLTRLFDRIMTERGGHR